MNVIYIAGPYRAATEWQVTRNIRRAEEAAAECWRRGWAVICPHLNTAHFGGVVPEERIIEGGFELLSRCDAVLLIGAWRKSAGALAEKERAWIEGKPVYTSLEDVPKWQLIPSSKNTTSSTEIKTIPIKKRPSMSGNASTSYLRRSNGSVSARSVKALLKRLRSL